MSKLHESKNHSNVSAEMDESELTAVEVKAIYDKTRNWVQEYATRSKKDMGALLNFMSIKKYGQNAKLT